MEFRKNYNGFSLMEMMVVLLIISIIAAASAPMVNKRLLKMAADKSPWVWTGTNNNIAYNLAGNNEQTASIGAVDPPFSSGVGSAEKARLYIDSGFGGVPQIALGASSTDSKVMKIAFSHNSLWMSTHRPQITNSSSNSIIIGADSHVQGQNFHDVILIGAGSTVSNGLNNTVGIGPNIMLTAIQATSVGAGTSAAQAATAIGNGAAAAASSAAIGASAHATGSSSIAIGASSTVGTATDATAIGKSANATGASSVAIGSSANSLDEESVAIGYEAEATKSKSVAIGYRAKARHRYSTAIGYKARTTKNKQIVLGNSDTTIHIPGDLVVDQSAYLNVEGGKTYIRIGGSGPYEITSGTPTVAGTVMKDFDYSTRKRFEGEFEHPVLIQGSSYSDRRLKNVGDVFKGGLAEIKKLEPYHYTFKKDKDKTPRVGVIAQDLQKIFPDAVIKGEDGFLRIRLEDIFYALVNAVKELDAKIENLKTNEIKELRAYASKLEKDYKDLEKENKALEKRLERLEKKLK